MSQTYQIPAAAVAETPLARALAAGNPALELKMHRGAQTPLRFQGIPGEVSALLRSAGVFDLGYRTFLRATGKDRVRWLNGMITQTVKGMNPGQTGYTLVLSPQGRIQGDADLYVHEEVLFLETDKSQAEKLLTHLRRYIIMDDVKLEESHQATTALGIAGPQAAAILAQLGASAPEAGTIQQATLAGVEVGLVGAFSPVVPRFGIHVFAEHVLALWNALVAAGATACGAAALDDLRVLEGVPAFDVDFSDKQLPQEAGLLRALNFTKGCYIGQETVERIRARASLHRSLRQFALEGTAPALAPGEKIEIRQGDAAVGELTSVATIALPGWQKTVALGIARLEALEAAALESAAPENASQPIRYEGGVAIPLTEPPQPPQA
jgi:folate-binding protein YgfZ